MNEAYKKALLHASHAQRLINEAKKNKVGRQCVNCNEIKLKFPIINVRYSLVNMWCEDCIKSLLKRWQPIDKSIKYDKPKKGYKLCQHCRTYKPLSMFPNYKKRNDSKYPYCRECCTERYYKYRIIKDYKKIGKPLPQID